jgi:hypothetical protein
MYGVNGCVYKPNSYADRVGRREDPFIDGVGHLGEKDSWRS